ncbi:NAD(P)-dependent alcohol dehydrogenase [Aestuariivita boseongensis]|uniref:NAD(P)-dependent alcohol dehydrogenase n=1 Tax=Aestuariivita boseongensis TaxID=1470562 RepID=UPI000AE09FA2|nr:NAD(P)-dependent alcohol dehydrogenase [Aestuariivita boseongensis]
MTTPSHMKAAVFHRYGPPETLTLCDMPVPQPAQGKIRVKVHATTVTRTDTATLRGHPFFARVATGLTRPKMSILGMDVAGVVDAVGGGVTAYEPGDRVFGLSPDRFGAHAEYVCLPEGGAIARLPDGLRYDEAVVGEGAWYASATTDRLNTGDRCLIYGGSGAIGTAAVQLAKLRGAEVTAVVGHRHLELARQLGADRVIDYQVQDFTKLGERFDLVFDAVGKTSWFACRPLLKPQGIFAATDLGPYWSNLGLEAWSAVRGHRRLGVPFPKDPRGLVQTLAGLLADGRFRGVFDRRYPLADIVAAFQYVEAGQKTGIVRVDMRSD